MGRRKGDIQTCGDQAGIKGSQKAVSSSEYNPRKGIPKTSIPRPRRSAITLPGLRAVQLTGGININKTCLQWSGYWELLYYKGRGRSEYIQINGPPMKENSLGNR